MHVRRLLRDRHANAPTDFHTLSLHDALPICFDPDQLALFRDAIRRPWGMILMTGPTGSGKSTTDRKSTRLNSSHQIISYAVFCLEKKNRLILEPEAPWAGLGCVELVRQALHK